MSRIHLSTVINPGARIADDVSIGPLCVIGPDVSLDSGCVIHNRVTIQGHTVVGKNVAVHTGAVVGSTPLECGTEAGKGMLSLGENTVIRECCQIESGSEGNSVGTQIGRNNLIMAYVHISRDCILKNNIVVANGSQISPCVRLDDGARVSGLVTLHEGVRVGMCAFVAGWADVAIDVPPFTLAEGQPAGIKYLNKEGMLRRGVTPEVMEAVKSVFKLCCRSKKLPYEEALKYIRETGHEHVPEIKIFAEFLREAR